MNEIKQGQIERTTGCILAMENLLELLNIYKESADKKKQVIEYTHEDMVKIVEGKIAFFKGLKVKILEEQKQQRD